MFELINMSEEKKIYFENQKTVIDFLSKDGSLYSELNIGLVSYVTPVMLDSKNYKRIFSIGTLLDSELFKEIVYQHPSGYYIYFSKSNYSEQNYLVKILYLPEKYNEIIMFINQLKKFNK